MDRPDRSPLRSLLAGAALAALVSGCGAAPPSVSAPDRAPATPSHSPTPGDGDTPSAAPSPRASTTGTPTGSPTRVVVVTEDDQTLVDAPVTPQGLDDRGILSPPSGIVGWYDEPGWPRPGLPGAAVLAGHVGTPASGPDTFQELPYARPGDRVTVTYDTGDEVHFVVVRSEGVPKERTPADDSIWDAGNPEPLLRLITCDPRTPLRSGHYEGNWVLWADLA